MCRVSNRKCVRFVSSIPLKSCNVLKRGKELKGYELTTSHCCNRLVLVIISGNFLEFTVLLPITADLICMFCV